MTFFKMAEFMYLFLLFDTYIDVHNEFRAFSSFVILSHNKTFVFQQALSYYNVLFFSWFTEFNYGCLCERAEVKVYFFFNMGN